MDSRSAVSNPKTINHLMHWLRNQLPPAPVKIQVPYQAETSNSIMLTRDAQVMKMRAVCLSGMMKQQLRWIDSPDSYFGLHTIEEGRVKQLTRYDVVREIEKSRDRAYSILPHLMSNSLIAAFYQAAHEEPSIKEASDSFLHAMRYNNTFEEFLDSLLPAGFYAVSAMIRVARMKQKKPCARLTSLVMTNSIPRIEDWANLPSPGFQVINLAVSHTRGYYSNNLFYDPDMFVALNWKRGSEKARLDFNPKIVPWVTSTGWRIVPKDRVYFSPCPAGRVKCAHFSAINMSVKWMMNMMSDLWDLSWPDSGTIDPDLVALGSLTRQKTNLFDLLLGF